MKTFKRGLIALVVVVLVYVLTSFVIGRLILAETARFAESLALQEGVTVHRLDYRAGLFSGVLRYDLDYVPPPESLPGAVHWGGLRHVQGEMRMRHGPWVGDGFALAAGEGQAEVPAQMRQALPELAAAQPLVKVKLRHAFDRSVRMEFVGLDHAGPVVSAQLDALRGTVELAGAKGQARFDAALDWLDFELQVQKSRLDIVEPADEAVSIAVTGLSSSGALRRQASAWTGTLELALEGGELHTDEGHVKAHALASGFVLGVSEIADGPRPSLEVKMALGGLEIEATEGELARVSVGRTEAEAELVEAWPQLWIGRSDLQARDLRVADEHPLLHAEHLRLHSEAFQRGMLFAQDMALELGSAQWGETRLGGGRLAVTLDGVDGLALSRMLEALARSAHVPPQLSEPQLQRALLEGAQIILAGHPSLSLEQGLHVRSKDDLHGRLVLKLAERDGEGDGLLEALMRLQVQGEVTAQHDALRELFRQVVEAEQGRPGVAVRETVEREGDARYQAWLAGMQGSPYVTVTPEAVSSRIEYAGEALDINGVPTDPMLALLLLAMLGGDGF